MLNSDLMNCQCSSDISTVHFTDIDVSLNSPDRPCNTPVPTGDGDDSEMVAVGRGIISSCSGYG